MRMLWPASALGCLLIVPFLSSCNGGSPSSVVKASFESCNAGDYSKAESAYSPDAQTALGGGIKSICDIATRNGTLSSVEILSESISGEGSSVGFRLHYKDGSTVDDHVQLIKVKGDWKMGVGG